MLIKNYERIFYLKDRKFKDWNSFITDFSISIIMWIHLFIVCFEYICFLFVIGLFIIDVICFLFIKQFLLQFVTWLVLLTITYVAFNGHYL